MKKYRVNYKTLISNLLTAAGVLAVVWLAGSYIEICCKNLTTADYSALNFFALLIK